MTDYSKKRFLVIDDQPQARDALRTVAQTLGAFAVEFASNYQDAIYRIRNNTPDIILCDYMLGFHIRHEIDVRLARIDTPEIVNYGLSGIDDPAKAYVQQCVPTGSVCVVNISRAEKYGRWLAEIFFCPGETDRTKILQNPRVLNDELVRGGFAKPYSGGKK